MDRTQMLQEIKRNLRLDTEDHDLMISDLIQDVCDYCGIPCEDLPSGLEPVIRGKAKGIIDYETVQGAGYRPEIASLKEGDGTITWAQTEGNTKISIYSLTDKDKTILRRYRRLRGYAKPLRSDV